MGFSKTASSQKRQTTANRYASVNESALSQSRLNLFTLVEFQRVYLGST